MGATLLISRPTGVLDMTPILLKTGKAEYVRFNLCQRFINLMLNIFIINNTTEKIIFLDGRGLPFPHSPYTSSSMPVTKAYKKQEPAFLWLYKNYMYNPENDINLID